MVKHLEFLKHPDFTDGAGMGNREISNTFEYYKIYHSKSQVLVFTRFMVGLHSIKFQYYHCIMCLHNIHVARYTMYQDIFEPFN